MRYWLVRPGTKTLEIADDGRTLRLSSRRAPKIAKDDVVVFLEGTTPRTFKRSGHVASVMSFEGKSAGDMRVTIVELEDIVDLPEELYLEDMRYSLTFVRNTRAPWVHFRRGYRLLPEHDFETLRLGEPFVARTGYFELINSLPEELKAEFEAEIILDAPAASGGERYFRHLERLHSFLYQRVFQAGQFLTKTHALALELRFGDANGVLFEHVFTDDSLGSVGQRAALDSLRVQAQRFESLRAELSQPLQDDRSVEARDVIESILEVLAQPERRQVEARFESIFRRAA